MMYAKRDHGMWQPDNETSLWLKSDYEPRSVEAILCGNICLVKPHKIRIKVEDLKLVRCVKGTRRHQNEKGEGGWESNQEFSLFIYVPEIGKPYLCIGTHSGLGVQFFLIDQLDFIEEMLPVLQSVNNNAFYDICACITGSVDHGYKMGTQDQFNAMATAYVDGRLKKRRRSGNTYKVEIERPPLVDSRYEKDEHGRDGRIVCEVDDSHIAREVVQKLGNYIFPIWQSTTNHSAIVLDRTGWEGWDDDKINSLRMEIYNLEAQVRVRQAEARREYQQKREARLAKLKTV